MDDAEHALRCQRLLQTLRRITTIMTEEWEKYKAISIDKNGTCTRITLTDEEVSRFRAQMPYEIQTLLEEAEKEWNENKPKPK